MSHSLPAKGFSLFLNSEYLPHTSAEERHQVTLLLWTLHLQDLPTIPFVGLLQWAVNFSPWVFLNGSLGILWATKSLMRAYRLSASVVAWWIHCIFSRGQQFRHVQHITQASPLSHGLPGNPENTTGQSNQSTWGGGRLMLYSVVIMGSQGGNPRQNLKQQPWGSLFISLLLSQLSARTVQSAFGQINLNSFKVSLPANPGGPCLES